jgi:hypothetical protein
MLQAAFDSFKEHGRDFDVLPLEGHPGWSYYIEPWGADCFNTVLCPWPDAPKPTDEPADQMAWVQDDGRLKVDAMLRKDGHQVAASKYFNDADLDVELGVTVHLIRDRSYPVAESANTLTIDLSRLEAVDNGMTTFYEGPVVINDREFHLETTDRTMGGVGSPLFVDDVGDYVEQLFQSMGIDPNDDAVSDALMDVNAGWKYVFKWDGTTLTKAYEEEVNADPMSYEEDPEMKQHTPPTGWHVKRQAKLSKELGKFLSGGKPEAGEEWQEESVARLVAHLLDDFRPGQKVWVQRGNRHYQGEVVDYDPAMGYLVRYFWKDPNHLGKGASTVILQPHELKPVTEGELGRKPMPAPLYNCSPGECTPRTDPETFISNWRTDTGWYGFYPVHVIAQEMEFRPSGPSMSRGHMGRVLDTLGPFNNINDARAAMEELFRKHQTARGRVYIYPKSVEPEPHGDAI